MQDSGVRESVVNITIFCCIAEHVNEWQRRARVQNFQETNSLSEDSDLELQSTMDFRWRSEVNLELDTYFQGWLFSTLTHFRS